VKAEPTRLLLSGAQGLLGRSIAQHWLASSPDAAVVGFGRSPRLPDTYPHHLDLDGRQVPARLPAALRGIDEHPRYVYVPCSLDDDAGLDDLMGRARPHVVIHSAAALRDDDTASLVRANVSGTASLVESCLRVRSADRFVLVSSGSVLGHPAIDHPLAAVLEGPADPYAISKRAGEQIAAALALRGGLPLAVARVFNLIGPGLQSRHLPAEVAARLEAVRRGAAPTLQLGDLSTQRDLVSVDDAAHAVVAVAQQQESPDQPWGGLVDIGSGTATVMRDLVTLMIETAGLTGRIELREEGRRPFDAPTIVADTAALAALDARPATPLAQTCAEMLAYVADQWDSTG
jgi:nucleoside-diphosphate-sugar epimerase